VRALRVRYQENNLSFNVKQNKGDDCVLQETAEGAPPIHIEGTAGKKVESFEFLGIHITDKLKWSTNTDSVVKKAQ
jgi:hypothetical protein